MRGFHKSREACRERRGGEMGGRERERARKWLSESVFSGERVRERWWELGQAREEMIVGCSSK